MSGIGLLSREMHAQVGEPARIAPGSCCVEGVASAIHDGFGERVVAIRPGETRELDGIDNVGELARAPYVGMPVLGIVALARAEVVDVAILFPDYVTEIVTSIR